jgi:hypothetical protein
MIGRAPRTTSQLINPRVRPSPTGVPPSSRAELVTPIVHDPSHVVAIGVAGLAMWVSRRPVASTELVRETASMTAEYAQTDQFRGASIHLCDLAGLEIRDCEVSRLKIVDCYGSDVYLDGDFERLVVNDVDVTIHVEAELDRQHPARVLARDATSPDDHRAAWDAIETLWEATLDRARLLPEAELHERSTANGRLSRRNDTCCSPAIPGSAMPCLKTKPRTTRWVSLPAGCRPTLREARAHPQSHPDAQRGARAAAPSHGHDAARRRGAHRGRA